MGVISHSLTITEETPPEVLRVDRAVQSLAATSRRQTQALFDNGCVTVDGDVCREPWRYLVSGNAVQVSFDSERRYVAAKRPPSYLGFEILFEDEHLIVVNKPANWLTIPSDKREKNTLVHRISDYLTKKNRGRRLLIYPAHRLDRGVSGVLVLGKTVELAATLRKQFEQHKPERQYLALVAGLVVRQAGTLKSFLAVDDQRTRHSTDNEEAGELAITHYKVERQFADTTLVRVWLETGRRNQIRVHFAEAGHPVLGDTRYEPKLAAHKAWPHDRIALHAARLSFEHPVTHELQQFEAAVPAEFEKFQQKQRPNR